jgi:superfamily II DNA or RNA helicase
VETRPYQNQAIQAIIDSYKAGVRRQLIVMATGTGKTVVFSLAYARIIAELATLLPGRMLVLAHREELIDQAQTTLQAINPTIKVGKEMNVHRAADDCKIVVSCVASIGRTDSKRMERLGDFQVIICDEAHHSVAATYMNVFTSAGMFEENSTKLLIGFTATPKRKNRVKKLEGMDEELISLSTVYEKIVFTYPIRKAIKDGWLVPIRGFRVKTKTSLDAVKVVAGDFQQDQLARTVNNEDRNLLALKGWLDYGEGRQTVGFTVDIAHAQALAELFAQHDIRAEAIWGDDPDRADKLERHKRKDITVLFNCQVLTEGYDDWRVSCILECAPTKSGSKYTQCIGRGTRLQDGTGNLKNALAMGVELEKKDCLVIDVVDNSKRCSLVTLPSLVGLDPEFDPKGKSITDVAEQFEQLAEDYPGVNFGGLKSLDEVDVYVESIDLFEDPYSEDVKNFSELCWMEQQDGSYVINVPERREVRDSNNRALFMHERLYIRSNTLDQYELVLENKAETRKLGEYGDLREAFEVADDILRRCRSEQMKLLRRSAFWHDNPVSEAAKNFLRKLLIRAKKDVIWCVCAGVAGPKGTSCGTCNKQLGLTAGQASTAINLLQAR